MDTTHNIRDKYSLDFYMYKFKVRSTLRGPSVPAQRSAAPTLPQAQLCPLKQAHDWAQCPYAHTKEKCRRRDPLTHNYVSWPCPDAVKVGPAPAEAWQLCPVRPRASLSTCGCCRDQLVPGEMPARVPTPSTSTGCIQPGAVHPAATAMAGAAAAAAELRAAAAAELRAAVYGPLLGMSWRPAQYVRATAHMH